MRDQRSDTSNWDSLPDDLKYRILARMPTSRSKLLLRSVARSWRKLLSSPSTHSRSLDDCENLDTNPAPHAWTAILEPLHALSIESSGDAPALTTLAHLPMGRLVELRLSIMDLSIFNAWAKPHLTRLNLETASLHGVALKVDRCPALRELNLQTLSADATRITAYLSQLKHLTSLSYSCNNLIHVQLPASCDVLAQVNKVPPELPNSTAQHLVSLKLAYPASQWIRSHFRRFSVFVDPLSSCQHLRDLTLEKNCNFEDLEAYGTDSYMWALRGVDLLPATLTSFTVQGVVMPAVSMAAVASYADGVFHLAHSNRDGLSCCANAAQSHRFAGPDVPDIADRGLLTNLDELPAGLTELCLSVKAIQVLNNGHIFEDLRILNLCVVTNDGDCGEVMPLAAKAFPALEVLVLDSESDDGRPEVLCTLTAKLKEFTKLRSFAFICEEILDIAVPPGCEMRVLQESPESHYFSPDPMGNEALKSLIGLTIMLDNLSDDSDGLHLVLDTRGLEKCDKLRECTL